MITDVSKDSTTVIIAVTVSSIVVVIVIVVIFLVIYKKNIKKMRKYEQQDIPLKQTLQEGEWHMTVAFSFGTEKLKNTKRYFPF